MKKIIYLFVILGTMFVGCDPIEDINNEIDGNKERIIVVDSDNYTLTADDYDDLGLTYGSFNSLDEAKSLLPDFLSSIYPKWGQGSSVLVGFNLYIGNAFDIRDYNLDQEDYTFSGSDGLGFNFDANPEDYLADILAANVSNAKEGDYRLAKYFQYTGDFIIVTPTVSLEENFDYGATAGDLTTITTNWTGHSGAAPFVGYAASSLSMTNYPSTDIGGSITISGSGSEDVNSIFTPVSAGTMYSSALVNFSAVSTGTYFFHFMDDTFGYSARVGVKDDGSGKMLFGIGASSSTLTYGTTAFNLDTTYLLVASYNIETGVSNLYVLTSPTASEPTTPEATNTGNPGLVVQKIGVRQGGGGPTGSLDGIRVANTWSSIMSNAVLPDEIIGDKTAGEKFYEFNGTAWGTPSNQFYAITDEDFASMGIPNFGSSISPDNYLTTFLTLKYPYAQEDDVLDLGYKYVSSSSGPGTRGNRFTFMDGKWMAYQSTIATSLQFGFNDGQWVPDNTIRYTFTGADVTFISNAFITIYPGPAANYGNYGSFDRRSGSGNYWSDEMLLEAFNALLDDMNPNAEEGQKYTLIYVIYNGSTSNEIKDVIKTGGVWVYQ